MDDGFLVKDQQNQSIHVKGDGNLDLEWIRVPGEHEQENPYLTSMQDFEQVHTSLSKTGYSGVGGKLFGRMSHVFQKDKNATFNGITRQYGELKGMMRNNMPTDRASFEAERDEIVRAFEAIVQSCAKYISYNSSILHNEGWQRLGVIKGLLASVTAEKNSFVEHADRIFAKITENPQELQTDVIWGNALGDMKQDVRFYGDVYTNLTETFEKKSMQKEGMKTHELLEFFSSASKMGEGDPRGEVLKTALKDFISAHKSEELVKEFSDFRAFVVESLHKSFSEMVEAEVSDYFVKPGEDPLSADVRVQYAKLMIRTDKYYQYWMAANAMAETLGLPVLSLEYMESGGELKDYDKLNPVAVQRSLTNRDALDRKQAKKTLSKYIADMDLLEDSLGDEKKLMQVPLPQQDKAYQVKKPMAKYAGIYDNGMEVDLAAGVAAQQFKDKMSQAQTRIDGRVKEDEITALKGKYDAAYWTGALKKAEGGDLCGDVLSGDMLLNALKSIATQAQITQIFALLFEGRKDLQKMRDEHKPQEEINQKMELVNMQIEEGMKLLVNVCYDHLRKMRDTYGTLIGSMHPEDVYWQYGDELYEHFSSLEAMKHIFDWVRGAQQRDPDYAREAKTKKFLTLGNFYYAVYHRMEWYFTGHEKQPQAAQAPEHFREWFEGDIYVQFLNNPENFQGIGGPRMTRAMERKYREKFRERAGKVPLTRPDFPYKLFGAFSPPAAAAPGDPPQPPAQ